ncbi:MAG: bile acid:sodium symporter family protein [Kangiellaceae bacterium]|nr:bile acid:sodium symporter family protein [Kangiellaceae bacterium]
MKRFNSLFPVWVILLSVIAYQFPTSFSSGKELIVPFLSAIMFFMGLTLSVNDFKRVLIMPKPIVIGVLLQFLIMPLAAFCIAFILSLPEQMAIGLIIVGCCAGGTASNVIAYLAKANVALSISMTLCSTCLGIVLTPLLSRLYIDASIDVDYLAMFLSIVKMVLLPVISGVVLNGFFRERLKKFEELFATLAVIAIVTIIAVIVALNVERLSQVGMLTLAAVALHNGFGLISGYAVSRGLRLPERDCRTIAIEVGMQNSGLGVALALKYFSPLAALPGAIFSIWHNIAGSLLASYWGDEKSSNQRLTKKPIKQVSQ